MEFIAIPGQPPVKYDMQCVVELVGTQKTVEENKITTGAGMTANGMAIFGKGMLERYGVQCKRDGTKVVVSGWKDPKTGKVYPVKRVKFTSQTMPKELMPKVTNPKQPTA